MPEKIWKQFENNPLTHSAAHYIMAINHLLKEQGYARVTDVAERLGITRGSCSLSLKPLKRRGLVLEDKNKFLQLSDDAQIMAQHIDTNESLLEMLFTDVLGVSRDQAEIDACKMEHLLSPEVSAKLAVFIKYIKAKPPTVTSFLKELGGRDLDCTDDPRDCEICGTGPCHLEPHAKSTDDGAADSAPAANG